MHDPCHSQNKYLKFFTLKKADWPLPALDKSKKNLRTAKKFYFPGQKKEAASSSSASR